MENEKDIVKVYTTPVCPWCDVAKNFLKENNVEFESVDVSQSQELAMELMQKTGQAGVPVIEINGEFVVGFDKKKIQELLNI